MTFIYVDNSKSTFKLDNGEVLTIWFDEYCEAQEVYLRDQDLSCSDSFLNSFYVVAGGALVLIGDLLKAGGKHMELCRQEDTQDAADHAAHIQSFSRTI